MNKNIFNRIEIAGMSMDVIVNTKFGSVLCSNSGDLIFHNQPITNHAMDSLQNNREIKELINNPDRKLSTKRSAIAGSRRRD